MKSILAASVLIPFTLLHSATAQEMSGKTELTDAQTDFFEKKIRPALVKHCYKCHSSEGEKVRGGLQLDTRDASHLGGDTGIDCDSRHRVGVVENKEE